MYKRSLGFSLLELIVVISILAVLSAILIPRISNYQAGELLKQSISQFELALKTAQSNAMTGVRCGSANNPVNKTKTWQVVITSALSYTLRPDCENGILQPAFNYTLSPGVSVNAIYFEKDGSTCGTPIGSKITFENISGKVNFESIGSCNPNTYNRLILVFSTYSGDTKSISLELGGTLYFNETQTSFPTVIVTPTP